MSVIVSIIWEYCKQDVHNNAYISGYIDERYYHVVELCKYVIMFSSVDQEFIKMFILSYMDTKDIACSILSKQSLLFTRCLYVYIYIVINFAIFVF